MHPGSVADMTTITLTGQVTLGMLLQMFRQSAGIDQRDMGKRIGASRTTISAWERDEREPSFSQVVKWAQITGQPLEALIDAVNAETASTEVETVSDSSAPRGTRTPNLLIGSSLDDEWAFWSIVEADAALARATDRENGSN